MHLHLVAHLKIVVTPISTFQADDPALHGQAESTPAHGATRQGGEGSIAPCDMGQHSVRAHGGNKQRQGIILDIMHRPCLVLR